MSGARPQRGAVLEGPNPFSPASRRPYVHLSDASHPFGGQEGLFVAVTTTRRPEAIELSSGDFATGGLPKRSFASPWVITTFKHTDVGPQEGVLQPPVVGDIATAAAGYLGVSP